MNFTQNFYLCCFIFNFVSSSVVFRIFLINFRGMEKYGCWWKNLFQQHLNFFICCVNLALAWAFHYLCLFIYTKAQLSQIFKVIIIYIMYFKRRLLVVIWWWKDFFIYLFMLVYFMTKHLMLGSTCKRWWT